MKTTQHNQPQRGDTLVTSSVSPRITTILSLLLLLIGIEACKKETLAPQPEMKVDRFYPNSGRGGTLVTIEGAGFGTDANQTTVNFNGQPAKMVNVASNKIVVQSPTEGSTGAVTLHDSGNTVTVGEYTYQDLSVHEISPNKAPAGAQVRIVGEGFAGEKEQAKVTIDEVEMPIVNMSDTVLVIEIPQEAESGQVTVRVDGTVSTGAFFAVQKVSGIKPTSGGPGTRVTISGSGFEEIASDNLVKFGDQVAEVVESTPDMLVVVVPQQVTSGPIMIGFGDYTFEGPVFQVVPAPVITFMTPLSGPEGQEITIEGNNFSQETEENLVTINGHEIPVVEATATRLILRSPGGMGSGNILLSVNGQAVEGPRFVDQNLGITRVSPEYGAPGMRIKVFGVGFSTSFGQNVVLFNGTAGQVVDATPTELTVVVPEGFTTGPLNVQVGGIEAAAPKTFQRGGILTIAGGPGSNAFSAPNGIVLDSQGNLFVADAGSNTIKKVTPEGEVSVFAGAANSSGYRDGQGTAARFSSMMDLVIDQQDNLYTSSTNASGTTYVIRKIDPNGNVSTPYSTTAGLIQCLSIDPSGTVYYADGNTLNLYRIGTGGTSIMVPDIYAWWSPAITADGSIYIGDILNWNPGPILKGHITNGIVDPQWAGGMTSGFADGVGTDARFDYPAEMRTDNNGNLIVVDWTNYAFRKINLTTKQVTTLARSSGGFADGSLSQARFEPELKIAPSPDGFIYFLDMDNRAVRMLIPE